MYNINSDAFFKLEEIAEFSLNLMSYAKKYCEIKKQNGLESTMYIKDNKIIVQSSKKIKYTYINDEEKEKLKNKKIEKDIENYSKKLKSKNKEKLYE